MLREQTEGFASDAEKFVADQEEILKRRLDIDPLTEEKIDEAQRKAGEREEQGR